MEHLTNEMERAAQRYLDRIDDMGGAVAAIESGYMQREIQEAAMAQQRELEEGRRVLVGVNRFVEAGERPQTIFRVNSQVARSQQERLRALKAERDDQAVAASLARLEEAARGEDNLMPAILEAVKAYATLGEMSDAMRKVFGEYRALAVV